MDNIGQKSFRLLKKIKDPKLEIDRLESYSLSLFIGANDFQVLITDAGTKRCVLLEDYVFDPVLNESDTFDTIKFIIDDHHLLLANFWKEISIIGKNKNFSFVPVKLFDAQMSASYLSSNASFDPHLDEIMISRHDEVDFINVFAVRKTVVDLMTKIYPGRQINFQHQSSALIKGILSMNASGERDIVIYVDRFGMHIVIVNRGELIFYNQYLIKKFEDYVRYIKMVSNELNFDIEVARVKLYGYMGENALHFKELKKSIPKLVFGQRPQMLNFGYVFDEVLDHQYFDLFSVEA